MGCNKWRWRSPRARRTKNSLPIVAYAILGSEKKISCRGMVNGRSGRWVQKFLSVGSAPNWLGPPHFVSGVWQNSEFINARLKLLCLCATM